jgi:TolB-like protein
VVSWARPYHAIAAAIIVLVAGLVLLSEFMGSPQPIAVAVLPFADLSPDGSDAHIAGGFTEEVTNALAGVAGLRVTSGVGVFADGSPDRDVRRIGRELGVRAVVAGSTRHMSGRVRVVVQLTDARTGYHYWSQAYERSDDDLMTLEQEIAVAAAEALAARLSVLGCRRGNRWTRCRAT